MTWLRIRKEWLLRSTQDGLEFITPERNINLEFVDPDQNREELAAILSGLNKVPDDSMNGDIGDTVENLLMEKVLELSDCRALRDSKSSGIEKILWNLRSKLVGSRGPIQTLHKVDSEYSGFPYVDLQLFIAKYGDDDEWSAGADSDVLVAELKALMEGVERHAISVIPKEELIKTSARQLGKKAIDPRRVVKYQRHQYQDDFPLAPFSREREYYWKEVTTLPEGKQCYLPAECIYSPFSLEVNTKPYTIASSSGVAAALSFEEALLRALYETVERDGFMTAWLNRLSMPVLRLETLSRSTRERIRILEDFGYELHLVNLTREFASVVFAIAVSSLKQPALVLGAACNFDLEKAISKALAEAEYQLYWTLRKDQNLRILSDAKMVKGVVDHMDLYTSPEHLSIASFLWEGKTESYEQRFSVSEGKEIDYLLEMFNSCGIEVVVVDLTPPFLKELGIWVIRVLPLGLVPVSFGHGMEPLGMARLKSSRTREHLWELDQPFPHPFG